MLTVNEQNSQDLCIKSCMECFEQLTRAIHYCLEKRYLNGEHLKLFFEAIDLCRVSSTLLYHIVIFLLSMLRLLPKFVMSALEIASVTMMTFFIV